MLCVYGAPLTPFKPSYPVEPDFQSDSWITPALFAGAGLVVAIASGLITSGILLLRRKRPNRLI
jgi:hypothetical protein